MPNMRPMELRDTVALMESADYKKRFKGEYCQTKIRHGKLACMIERYEDGTLDFEPTCPVEILKEQLDAMADYLRCLECRASIEGIVL